MGIRAELHCHNIFSNFHVGAHEPPYDCSVGVADQLEQARVAKLDALFVTNHNTLSGYDRIIEYRDSHEKFAGIRVYPAEEVTTDTGAHILAYGIYREIPPGLSMDEILDIIKSQGAVSSAPHPFSLLDAVRENAARCDIIEVFNSNNIDAISNMCAAEFAARHSMVGVAGSDSHVLATLGRCVNVIESENRLDDILASMRSGRIRIEQCGYAQQTETMEHLRYKIRNSRDYLEEYINANYPGYGWLLRLLMRLYNTKPDSMLWNVFYRIGVYLMGRVSARINRHGIDPSFMKERDLLTMLRMAL